MSIGVVTQRISSPFYGEALSGIEVELEGAGYVPLFVSGPPSAPREIDSTKPQSAITAAPAPPVRSGRA